MPSLRSHPLNVGRIAWYLATDAIGTGTTWTDLVSGRVATVYTPSWGATTHDGGRGELRTPTVRAPWPKPAAACTVALWAYSTGQQAHGATIVHNDAFALKAYDWPTTHANGTKDHLILYGGYGTGTTYIRTHTVFPADAWTHVTAVFDGADLRVYLNGVWSGDFASLPPGALLTTAPDEFTVGYERDVREQGWVGSFDDLSIWSRGLSTQEIEDNFNESAAGHPATLDYSTGPPPTGDFLAIGTAAGQFLMLRQNT